MVIASVLGAATVTILLLGAAVVWAVNEQYIARVQGWDIAFSLKEELVKTFLLALGASLAPWVGVSFVASSPDDMPADFYLPPIAATVLAMFIYIGIVVWRVAVANKVKAGGVELVQYQPNPRRTGR